MRTSHIYIREVTGYLPAMPDRVIGTDHNNHASMESHPYANGRWFYVELHLANFGWYGPAALGIVSTDDDETHAELVSMHVEDSVRREGYGTQIIESAGERWPDLIWTDCDSSRPFHLRLVEKGIAETCDGCGYYDFVSKSKRKTNEYPIDD